MGKRRRGYNGGFMTAAQALQQGIGAYQHFRNRFRGPGSQTQTKTKKYRSGEGLTTQHDRMLQYRKRRMPKFKRRKWSSFKRRVEWVINSQTGTQTAVFNGAGYSQAYTSGVTDQVWAAACLYGRNGEGASKLGWDDLYRMFSTTAGAPTTAAGYEYHFKSAVLDITISAMPSTGTGVPLEVDIYEVWCKKMGPRENVGGDNAINDIVAGLNSTLTGNYGTGGVALNMGQRGVTLFDMPNVMSQQGWKVMKKYKCFIPTGGQTTYQIRDAREHVVDSATITGQQQPSYQGFSVGGLTKFVIICAKPIIGYGPIPTPGAQLFQIGATRKYSWVVNPNAARTSVFAP